MFFRFSLAIVLIGTGIASPWLVQDWLATEPSERSVGNWAKRMVELPETWGKWIHSDGGSETAVALPEVPEPVERRAGKETEREGATGSTRTPYPLAARTARVLRGFLPGGMEEFDDLGSDSSRPTSFSRSITKETGEILDDELSRMGLRRGSLLFLRIFKEEKELEVWMQKEGVGYFKLFKVYRLRDLSGSLGPKLREGDRQSPEGFYSVSSSRMRPATRHHLGMDLGYPNQYDTGLGRTGDEILIHGGTTSSGSFALSTEHMNELFTLADSCLNEGHRYFCVHIFPFRMTDSRMEEEWNRQPKWIDFWTNLKEGYDFFDNAQFPPSVEVDEGRYAFRLPEAR